MSRFNYFRNVVVDGYAFPTNPQVSFNFLSDGLSLLNRDATATLEYSFDGYNLHGDLIPSTSAAGVVFDNRIESRIWLRGQNGLGTVRVEAWGGWGRTA